LNEQALDLGGQAGEIVLADGLRKLEIVVEAVLMAGPMATFVPGTAGSGVANTWAAEWRTTSRPSALEG